MVKLVGRETPRTGSQSVLLVATYLQHGDHNSLKYLGQ
jgi:hypothetical protein